MKENENLPATMPDLMDATIIGIQKATQIAEAIKNSKFGKNFETVDDKNNAVIKTEDIVAAILFGQELGLTPMKTLALGSELNKNTYYAIDRGRAMGLDVTTSIKNIHTFTTGGKVNIYVGVHVISKVLIDAKVDIEWVNDFDIHYWYYDSKTKEEISKDLAEDDTKYLIITSTTTKEEVESAKNKGLKYATRKADRITSAIFTRGDKTPVHIKYYLSEAVEAELHKGTKDDGTQVTGKDNWNKYPRRQMRNRVIILGGREVAADKLHDTYLPDEISSIHPNAKIEDTDHEEVSSSPLT